jgi:hypothetical protein
MLRRVFDTRLSHLGSHGVRVVKVVISKPPTCSGEGEG